jgi:hypothetical protein
MTSNILNQYIKKINTSTIFGIVEKVTITTAVIDSDGEKFVIKVNILQVVDFERAMRQGAEIAVRCVDRSTPRAIGGRAFFTIEKEAQAIEIISNSEAESFELMA